MAEFRAQLGASLGRAAALQLKFDAPAVAADATWLQPLLRDSKAGGRSRDQIAELAAARLAKVAAPALLADSYLQTRGYFTVRIVASGLDTMAGRALLIARIGDAKVPRADRLRYAGALGNLDLLLHPSEAALGDIAALALRVRADQTLTSSLLGALGSSSQISYGSAQEARVTAQKWRPALAQLRQLYRQTNSPKLRFQIETLTFNADPQALRSFSPSLGPVLSLVEFPADPARIEQLKERQLFYTYDIRQLEANPNGWKPQIEMLNLATSKSYFLSSPNNSAPNSFRKEPGSSSGGETIAIPANVPPGQYLVRYRFLKDGRVVSVGHGFEIKL